MTGLGIQALQQLTGINFIFYYGTSFFQNSGIANPFIITIATNVVNVGMTVPGIWAVDRLGRRFLLLYGAAGMAFSQLIVAIVGVATPEGNQAAQKVLVAFVCIFIAHFAATWGPLAWVVTSEIYPTTTRGKQMSMSTASNWLLIFAIVTLLLTSSTTFPVPLVSRLMCSGSGEDVVSSVSFSPTSAFPKPRVSPSNKSISSTATRPSESQTLSANKSSTKTWDTKLETLTELPRTPVPSITRRRLMST